MSSEAGPLLRNARRAAGRTQAEVGTAVGVDQSQVSAYEGGRREPTLPTLRRLLAGSGHRLEVEVEPLEPAEGWQPLSLASLGGALCTSREPLERRRLALEFVRGFGEATRLTQRRLLVDRPPEVGERWDALLGALAEHFAFHEDFPVPSWAVEPQRFLAQAWFWIDLPSVRRLAILTAPASFRRRNVWVAAEDLGGA